MRLRQKYKPKTGKAQIIDSYDKSEDDIQKKKKTLIAKEVKTKTVTFDNMKELEDLTACLQKMNISHSNYAQCFIQLTMHLKPVA